MTGRHEHARGAHLSPEGLARKQAMLAEHEAAVRRPGRPRTPPRRGMGGPPLAQLAVPGRLLTPRTTPPIPVSPPAIARTDPSETTTAPRPDRTEPAPTEVLNPPPPRVVYVANDPRALDRFAAPPTATRVQRLTDEQLLAELDALGMPAGIIRTEQRVRLAFHTAPTLADNRTP